jgi:hypothetical protein
MRAALLPGLAAAGWLGILLIAGGAMRVASRG